MTTIVRISIILAAALVVVGLTLGLSKTSFVQNLVPAHGFQQRQAVGQAQASMDTTTVSRQTRETAPAQPASRRGHNEPSGLFGLLQVFQNLVIISLIILPFAVGSWLLNRGKKRISSGQPQPTLDQETYA